MLFWVTPTQAQNETPPIAIGSVAINTPIPAPPTPATATLTGQESFDPDDNGEQADLTNRGIVGWKWEVVTDAYSWVSLTPAAGTNGSAPTGFTVPQGFDSVNPNATFTVPSPALAARYGQTIEFRLTVIDDNNPAATDTTTVTFNINQGPTADIAVSASLKNPMDINWYDDDDNGVRDDPDEVYNVEGIIDGPGENGNADNEWDIMEGARLTLDGSGSTDPDGRPIPTAGHDWDLVYLSDDNNAGGSTLEASITAPVNSAAAQITDSAGNNINYGDTDGTAGDAGIADTKKIDIIHPDPQGGNNYVTLGQLTNGDGTLHDPVYVYYKLTVTDTGSATNSAIVKIVIHDVPQDPRVTIDDLDPPTRRDSDPLKALIQKGAPIPGATQKYVILPGTTVNFRATGSDGDGGNPTYSWEGASAVDADGMIPGDANRDGTVDADEEVSGSTAAWTAPRNVEDGTSFTVTVTATDTGSTGRTGSHSYELVVANNRRPEAVAPGALGRGPGGFSSALHTRDGGDGGDLVPVPDNSQTTPVLRASGIQTLRGFGFDPDGPIAIFNWSELAYPTVPVIDTDAATTTEPAGLELGLTTGVNDPNNDTNLDLPVVVTLSNPPTTDELAALAAEARKAPRRIVLPRVPVLEIENAFSEVASFEVPEIDFGSIPKHLKVQIRDTGDWDDDGCVNDGSNVAHTDPDTDDGAEGIAGDANDGPCFGNTGTAVGDSNHNFPSSEMVEAVAVPIAFSVIDSWGVIDTDIVTVFIVDDQDRPVADAGGPGRQVNSGDFVRLSGILSSDPDPADQDDITFQWIYTGIATTDPLTQNRRPITPAEERQGFIEGQWLPYDGYSTVLKMKADADDIDDDKNVTELLPYPHQVFSNHDLNPATRGTGDAADYPGVFPSGTGAGTNPGSRYGANNAVGGDPDDDGVPVDWNVLPNPHDTNPATTDDDSDGTLDIHEDSNSDGIHDVDAVRGQYHPTAGGLLKNAGQAYPYSARGRAFPYFDAPRLSHFHNVQFSFRLTVTVDNSDEPPTSDSITVSVVSAFYTGNIDGPGFCTGASLGGPTTYAYDSDGDGVSDTCSLNTTRRATVAIQNALETLAALNPETFSEYLHGTTAVDVSGTDVPGTCRRAPRTLGDTPAQLLADSCGTGQISSPPAPVDPAVADVFFSGVITGPNYCTNLSLGGATTYAFDSDDDGIADVCSLPYTKREAVARQHALAMFQSDDQYEDALKAACTALGTTNFGDNARDLARDECERPARPTLGTPIPTADN